MAWPGPIVGVPLGKVPVETAVLGGETLTGGLVVDGKDAEGT